MTILNRISTHQEWMDDAACCESWVDPDWFFPDLTSAERQLAGAKAGYLSTTERKAKRVCLRCPVRATCLTEALERDEEYGVWGGTLGRERRAAKNLPVEARSDALELMLLRQSHEQGLCRAEEVVV